MRVRLRGKTGFREHGGAPATDGDPGADQETSDASSTPGKFDIQVPASQNLGEDKSVK